MRNLSLRKGKVALYYPRGKEGDSVELLVLRKRGDFVWAHLTSNGVKDASYYGWLYELSGEVKIHRETIEILR